MCVHGMAEGERRVGGGGVRTRDSDGGKGKREKRGCVLHLATNLHLHL